MTSRGGVTDKERLGVYLAAKLDSALGVTGSSVTEIVANNDPDLADYTYRMRIPYTEGVMGRVNDFSSTELSRVFKSQDMGKDLVRPVARGLPPQGATELPLSFSVNNPALAVRLALKNDEALAKGAGLAQR